MTARKASGQGERTKAKLLDAARVAFAERGFGPARVDDVVKRAGTSHGTFYLYFQNKDDVLEALAAQTADEARALAVRFEQVVAATDRHEALRDWVSAFFDLYRRDWPVLQAWIQAEASAPRLDRLGREVLADVARGLATAVGKSRSDVNPGIAATAIVAMLERFSYFWIVRGGAFDRDNVLDTLAGLMETAIFASNGRPPAKRKRA